MLSDTLFRVARQEGLRSLQLRGEGGARELSSWRLKLGAGKSEIFVSQTDESVFVLQEGSVVLDAGGKHWEASRAGVFQEPASALYLPRGMEVNVSAATEVEGIFMGAPTESAGSPKFLDSGQVNIIHRGVESYAREVHDIFVKDSAPQRLLVGETFTPPGNWSSYPPHKHDGRDGESKLEEVYHYRVEPDSGFGYQTLYTAEGESVTHMVKDGDAVVIPYGYHPVAAPPGYRLYYLWALVGEERKLAVYDDPQHSWITAS